MHAHDETRLPQRAQAADLRLGPELMGEMGHRTIDKLIDQMARETAAPVARELVERTARDRLAATQTTY